MEIKPSLFVKLTVDSAKAVQDLDADLQDVRYIVGLVDCSRQIEAVEVGQRIIDRRVKSLMVKD